MRVLAVIDRPDWALAHHCSDLKSSLSGRCSIDVRLCDELEQQDVNQFADYNCIYFSWHQLLLRIERRFKMPSDVDSRLLIGLIDYHSWDGGHSIGSRWGRASELSPFLLKLLSRYTNFVAISNGLAQAFSELRPRVAHHGVNCNIFFLKSSPPIQKSDLVVGWVGTLTNTKHNYGLFDSIRRILSGVVGFQEACVRFDGDFCRSRVEMNDFYNQIDVLLVTSTSEGSPMPPIEALGCGVPTIGPPVGALPELVKDGWNGYLINSYEPEEYAERILMLLHSPSLLSMMRRNCLHLASTRWNYRTTANEWYRAFCLLDPEDLEGIRSV